MAKKKSSKLASTKRTSSKAKPSKASNAKNKAKSKPKNKSEITEPVAGPMASMSSLTHPPADIPVEFLYESGGIFHYGSSCCSVPLHSSEITSSIPLTVVSCDPEPPTPPAASQVLDIPRLQPSALPFRYPAETRVGLSTPAPRDPDWQNVNAQNIGNSFTFVAAQNAPQKVRDLVDAINGTVFAGYAINYHFENRCNRCNASEMVDVAYLRFFPTDVADNAETESLVVYDCNSIGKIGYLRMKNALGYTGEFAVMLSWI